MKNQLFYSSMIDPEVQRGKADPVKDIADAIGRGAEIGDAGGDRVKVNFASPSSFISDTRILFLGCDVSGGKISVTTHKNLHRIMQNMKADQVKGVAVFTILNSGTRTALAEVKSILEPKGIKVLDDEFSVKVPGLFSRKKFPSEEDLAAAKAFGEKVIKDYRAERSY